MKESFNWKKWSCSCKGCVSKSNARN